MTKKPAEAAGATAVAPKCRSPADSTDHFLRQARDGNWFEPAAQPAGSWRSWRSCSLVNQRTERTRELVPSAQTVLANARFCGSCGQIIERAAVCPQRRHRYQSVGRNRSRILRGRRHQSGRGRGIRRLCRGPRISSSLPGPNGRSSPRANNDPQLYVLVMPLAVAYRWVSACRCRRTLHSAAAFACRSAAAHLHSDDVRLRADGFYRDHHQRACPDVRGNVTSAGSKWRRTASRPRC